MEDSGSEPFLRSPPRSNTSTPLRRVPAIGYGSPLLNVPGEEILNASFMSSTGSTVRVEITDAEEGVHPSTAAALRCCKQQVLRPYWRLLCLIGWRAFGREAIYYSRCWKCINVIYPFFIILLLLFTYTYQVLACQGRLDVDGAVTVNPYLTAYILPSQSCSVILHYYYFIDSVVTNDTNSLETSSALTVIRSPVIQLYNDNDSTPHCYHIFTTYIIPDVLHLIAFVMGLWIFRLCENEELNALIEHVYLQASPLQTGSITQANMIRSMRLILILGGVWIVSTLVLHGMFLAAFDIFNTVVFDVYYGNVWHYVILGVQAIGILVVNSINTAIVINYAAQCEMLIYYIVALDTRLQEKSSDLRVVMQDILRVRQSISRLNGPIARMTSLCVVNFAELTVIGLCLLILNKFTETLVWLYRGFFVLVWIVYLLFPLIQAARLNSHCERFKHAALEVRVFGYQNCTVEDLDSFLLFLSSTKFSAKLFHIPVKPSYLLGITVLSTFTMLILLQTGVIGESHLFF
ncbi:uncharacterized protein LOC102807715 [Saccoglossus kowalevskii]